MNKLDKEIKEFKKRILKYNDGVNYCINYINYLCSLEYISYSNIRDQISLIEKIRDTEPYKSLYILLNKLLESKRKQYINKFKKAKKIKDLPCYSFGSLTIETIKDEHEGIYKHILYDNNKILSIKTSTTPYLDSTLGEE